MTPFQDKAEMVRILTALWDRIFATPEIVGSITGTKLVAKFRIPDFEAELFIDIASDPPRFFWDPDEEARFDVEMILSSGTCHRFWMERLNIPLALASRKVIAKGSIQKALKLLPALKPAFSLYPGILGEQGRSDLLVEPGKGRRKLGPGLFRRKKSKRYGVEALPVFPLSFAEVKAEGLEKEPSAARKVTEADILRVMYTIRAFEEHLSEAFREGSVPTEAIHLSIGQEGIAAGVCLNLKDTDYLNTTHRGHGHIIAKGADLKRMMAELYGKAPGLCGGKGGSMHVTDGERGVLGANGIVGAGYLLAMGAGFSIKRRGRDDISVVFAGDGSVNQGMFHEAMNMIAVFDLPVLVVVENNLYGEFTPIERHSAVIEIHKRARAYNIESMRIDGNDAAGVFAEIGALVGKMRIDGHPRLVELMTYRWHGHMEGEAESYRTAEEKDEYRQKDPISRFRTRLTDRGVLNDAEEDTIKAEAEAEVRDAVAFALGADEPTASALFTDVYCPEDKALYEGSIPACGAGEQMSVSLAINEALAEEMEADESVFLWGEDVTLGGYFNVTEGLVERFGSDRVIDTPISENGIIGGAVGAAMTGMRPVAEILFSDFLSCCMDPILNQAAKLRYMTGGQVSIPLTIRSPLGSGIGMAAQHSQSMERFFFGIPGLIVAAPSDAYTAKGLLKSAVRSNNPVLFFEHKLLYANPGVVPAGEYTLPLGKARVVREGGDVTIVTHLLGVSVAIDAAQILAKKGIDVEIVDLVCLYPLDTETVLSSVSKTGRLVTLEEGHHTGGIGSEVIARVALAGFDLLDAAPVRIAAPECPIPYARNLENAMLPDPAAVAERIERALF